MKTTAVSIAVFLFISHVGNVWSKQCKTDKDCMFMGRCDQASSTCRCSISCAKYQPDRICLSHMKFPRKPCAALSLACESQLNVKITPFNITLFRTVGSCQNMPYSQHQEFCEDQSYCSGNGLCMKQPSNGVQYCRCNKQYSGERCESRLFVLESRSPGNVINPTVSDSDTERSLIGGSSVVGAVAPYMALGVLSVILTCCFVMGYAKRANKCKSNNPYNLEPEVQVPQEIGSHHSRSDDEIRRQHMLELKASPAPQRKHAVAIEMPQTKTETRSCSSSSLDSTTPL